MTSHERAGERSGTAPDDPRPLLFLDVDGPDVAGWPGLHWKTPALVAWAAGRPFAWVDDEIGAADRAWVAARHAGPALPHHVDARRGLGGNDCATLAGWGASRGGWVRACGAG